VHLGTKVLLEDTLEGAMAGGAVGLVDNACLLSVWLTGNGAGVLSREMPYTVAANSHDSTRHPDITERILRSSDFQIRVRAFFMLTIIQ
jgi:hypothetical protein